MTPAVPRLRGSVIGRTPPIARSLRTPRTALRARVF